MALNLKIGLFDPGMTDLHRAGLAGLYMTLSAFSERRVKIPGLTWSLSDEVATLKFSGDLKATLDGLFRASFQVDDDGCIRFPGLERDGTPTVSQKLLLHESLTNSFLQHGRHRKTGQRKTVFHLINDKPVKSEMLPVISYRHQEAVDLFFYGDSSCLRESVPIGSWLYPGGTERHSGFEGDTMLQETVPHALCLLYAPVGCIYFRILSRFKLKKLQTCMVIPHVFNLKNYAEYRKINGDQVVLKSTVTGVSDAALSYLVDSMVDRTVARREIGGVSGSCRVFGLGRLGWSAQQKTRSMVRSYRWSTSIQLQNYELAMSLFKTRLQLANASDVENREVFFLAASILREFISDNIADGRRWYQGFSKIAVDRNFSPFIVLEAKELCVMANEAHYETSREKAFLDICYSAWAGHMRRAGARANKEGAAFGVLADREREKWRSQFSRARTARDLRSVCTAYFSRSGMDASELNGGVEALLELLSMPDWMLAKDLAVLALVSYRKNRAPGDEAEIIVEED